MSSESIIEAVRTKYDRDDRVPHPMEIAISERAGTVTLRGTVGSFHELRAAGDIATSVRGVRRVDNELSVNPRDRVEDGELRGAALQTLLSDPAVPADQIDVTVRDGWLTLKGEVKHQNESNAAFEAVAVLPGVGGITNEIKVVTAGGF